jgi:hypothetical protein
LKNEHPEDLKVGDVVEYTETVGGVYNYRGIAVFLGAEENGNYKFFFAKLQRQHSKNLSTYEVSDIRKVQNINPALFGRDIFLRKLDPNEVVDF